MLKLCSLEGGSLHTHQSGVVEKIVEVPVYVDRIVEKEVPTIVDGGSQI